MLRCAAAFYALDVCGKADSAASDWEEWPTYGCKHRLDNLNDDRATVLRAIWQSD
jgi:hypothetical protein